MVIKNNLDASKFEQMSFQLLFKNDLSFRGRLFHNLGVTTSILSHFVFDLELVTINKNCFEDL